MATARIMAVSHVHIDVPPGCAVQMQRFYGDLIGLPILAAPDDGETMLCFGANRLQMRLMVRERPTIAAFRRRLTLEVDSLINQSRRFDDARVSYCTHRGFRYTERRLFVSDPVGHLLELKQVWPL